MGESNGRIPVAAVGAVVLPLRRGGSVTLRRIRSSVDIDIAQAARLRDGDTASQMRWYQLRVRWAVRGASGLKYSDTGEPVAFALEHEQSLGTIASAAVYDALDEADVADILLVARGVLTVDDLERRRRVLAEGGTVEPVAAAAAETLSEGQAGN